MIAVVRMVSSGRDMLNEVLPNVVVPAADEFVLLLFVDMLFFNVHIVTTDMTDPLDDRLIPFTEWLCLPLAPLIVSRLAAAFGLRITMPVVVLVAEEFLFAG